MRKNMKYKITKATNENTEEILKLYHSLIGKDGCTWDLDYPSKEDIKKDIAKQALYIVLNKKEIIAVAAAGEDDELKEINCYSKEILNPCDLARIGVKEAYQNKGIAKFLIQYLETEGVKRGFDGIHFLVSKTNPHAKAVYDHLNYTCCGEIKLYEKERN